MIILYKTATDKINLEKSGEQKNDWMSTKLNLTHTSPLHLYSRPEINILSGTLYKKTVFDIQFPDKLLIKLIITHLHGQ